MRFTSTKCVEWKFQPAAPPPPKEEKETNVDPKSKTQFFHVFGGTCLSMVATCADGILAFR